MKRIFVAIGLPLESTEAIGEVYRKLKTSAGKKELNISWSPKENWHITLAFIGETPEEKITSLRETLRDFVKNHGPFSIALRQLGGFPETQGARVLWVGVTASRSLVEFQRQLVEKLSPWGYKPDFDEYKPHLTLAKLRNHKNITDLISPWVRKDFGSVKVGEIRLYESQQMGTFSQYVELERFLLNRESTAFPQSSESDSN